MTPILETLCKIPEIKTYMENAEFMIEIDSVDSVDTTFLTNRCFEILVDQLESVGIKLTVPIGEVIEDYYQGESLIDIFELFHPIHLANILKSNEEMTDMIKTIIDSVPTEDVLTYLIEYLSNELNTEKLQKIELYLKYNVMSTSLYVDSLKKEIDQINIVKPSPRFDIDKIISVMSSAKEYARKLTIEILSSDIGELADKDKLDNIEEILCEELRKIDMIELNSYIVNKDNRSLNSIKEKIDYTKRYSSNFLYYHDMVTGADLILSFIIAKSVNHILPDTISFEDQLSDMSVELVRIYEQLQSISNRLLI
jgi:hypothetical protein